MRTKSLHYLPWIIGIGLLMETLDTTIINTAIPQIAKSLAVYPINLKIAITSYLLTLGAFIPISGAIADRFGSKRTFMLAIIIFLLGSILCGFSLNLIMLVLGRLIQGIGGALMTPVGRLILIQSFRRSEIIKAFSYLTIIGQLGPTLGPTVGGTLTTFISWRFVFFVNIPIGCLALLLFQHFIQEHKKEHMIPFDFYGFILFGVAAGLLIFSLTLITQPMANYWLDTTMLIGSLILLFGYYRHTKKVDHPSLDLTLFRIRTFKIAVLGSLIIRIGMGGIPFLLPLLFQVNFGLSAFYSGLLLLPYGIAMILAKPWIKKMLTYFGYRRLLIINPIIISFLILGLCTFNPEIGWPIIIVFVFFMGLFSSFQFTYMNTLNFVDISDNKKSKATSLSSVFQQIAMTLGVCFSAGLLIINEFYYHSHFISLFAFRMTFVILAVVVFLSVLIFRNLKPEDGMSSLH